MQGYDQLVEKLRKCKAFINMKNSQQQTPLALACLYGHKKIVERLLEDNAEKNCQDIWQNTPLHYAAKNGNKEICELLLAKKADFGILNCEGLLPYDVAILDAKDVIKQSMNLIDDIINPKSNGKDFLNSLNGDCPIRPYGKTYAKHYEKRDVAIKMIPKVLICIFNFLLDCL